jgi:dienelactone hydrolase
MRDLVSGAGDDIARELVRSARRDVPLAIWRPAVFCMPRPLVLIGHGGSGHKTAAAVERVAHALVRRAGFVVAAIDGPVHGERAAARDAQAVRDDFRALWAAGTSVNPMVADWTDALDDLCSLPLVDSATVGWYGLSMGTAYGLPVVGRTPRVRCAVLGLWGSCRPRGDEILRQAADVRVPVLFQAKPDDEIITMEGARAVFEALGSAEKRLTLHEGTHLDIGDAQLDEAMDFLQRQLQRVAT